VVAGAGAGVVAGAGTGAGAKEGAGAGAGTEAGARGGGTPLPLRVPAAHRRLGCPRSPGERGMHWP